MNYKIFVYAIFLLLSIYVISAVNIEKFLKRDKELEAKLLVMILSIISSYLLTNFVWDFLNL